MFRKRRQTRFDHDDVARHDQHRRENLLAAEARLAMLARGHVEGNAHFCTGCNTLLLVWPNGAYLRDCVFAVADCEACQVRP